MKSPGNSPLGSAAKRRKYGTAPEVEVDSPPWLPNGWKTYEKLRLSGITAGTKDRYYFDPNTGHRFRSMPEVIEYKETGQIRKPKPKAKQLKTGNNEFQSITLHSEFQAVSLQSAEPENNDIKFNQDRERDEQQNQRSTPQLKNVNTIEFLKEDGLGCSKERSDDDVDRKKFLLELDLNKIPEDTDCPFDSTTNAEDQVYNLQNSVKVGVTDRVVVGAGEQNSPRLLNNAFFSNTFLGYATPKPEASLLSLQGQTNNRWLTQSIQDINTNVDIKPSHYVRPMAKCLFNTGSSSAPPEQQKVIPIHDPASPCSVLPVEKLSDKQKTTLNIKSKKIKKRKTTGILSKVTGKEFKRYLAELGRKLCINACLQNQSASETLAPFMNIKSSA